MAARNGEVAAARAARLWLAACALAGCTVAIPDPDRFPEARTVDAAVADATVADAAAKDADATTADAADTASDAAPQLDGPAADDGAAAEASETGGGDGDGSVATEDTDTGAADVDAEDVAAPLDGSVDVAEAVTSDAENPDADNPDAENPDAVASDGAVDAAATCTAADCEDANPCTVDACDLAAQCTHAAQTGTACPDDGLPCTADVCSAGACIHTAVPGDGCLIAGACWASGTMSGNGCAVCAPLADPATWTALPATATCSDGSLCTVGDHCGAGVCLAGSPAACDDGNPCTVDACDALTGCSNGNVADGEACPAVGVCQLPGFCGAGVCPSSPQLWSTTFDGGLGQSDALLGVATTAAGQVLVAGWVAAAGGSAGYALHLDAGGFVVETLPGLKSAAGAKYTSVAAASTGAVALAGSDDTAAWLTVVQADGAQLQLKPFAASAGIAAATQVVAVAGSWWLAGHGAGGSAVAAVSTAGVPLWTTPLGGATYVVADLRLTALGDGGALAFGSAKAGTGTQLAYLARLSAAGKVLWQRSYGGGTPASFRGLAVAADGSLEAVGSRNLANSAIWFVHLAADGTFLSDAQWSGSAASAAVAASDGTWRVLQPAATTTWLGAFDPRGNLLWQKTIDGLVGADLALLPSGALVVAGTDGLTPSDLAVARVDAWGEGDCATSKLCANLGLEACADGVPCTADLCVGGACSHPALAGACDDGDVCSVGDGCSGAVCSGSGGLFDATDPAVSQWQHIGAGPDGGAVTAGSAGAIARLGPAGKPMWSQFLGGGAVSDLAILRNGWVAVLQGQSGGTLRFFTADGVLLADVASVQTPASAKSTGVAALADGRVAVVGTTNVGLSTQSAFVDSFLAVPDGSGVLAPEGSLLKGSVGASTGVAIAAATDGGCGVLTVEGVAAKLHRLDAKLTETWVKTVGVSTLSTVAAMPDGGWVLGGLGPKGLALERYGPDGSTEFAVQLAVAGLSDVRGLAALADGSGVVAVQRLAGGFSQGGVAHVGPLGNILGLDWGNDGSQLLGIAAVRHPDGAWAVGSRTGGGWLWRTDNHGNAACALSGSCVSQSLICDDQNGCTRDGCIGGACVATLPADPWSCPGGQTCTAEGACPPIGTCGDGKCNLGETSSSCPGDCSGQCATLTCGDSDPCTVDYCVADACQIGGAPDGTPCALGKVCAFGKCVLPKCGDGSCQSGETADACADCPGCGNGSCDSGENNHTCPADCAKPASGCQNMCGWHSLDASGGLCWCVADCTPGQDCCPDKSVFCP